MKKFFFILWCALDLPACYLLFLSFKELINHICLKTVLDFVYGLFIIIVALNVQIREIIFFFKQRKKL
ncbi:MAG: hypothetical protein IK024_11685 [Treponema sp.]|nr:hypothetical protein [Treponema sp.]